MKRVLIDTCAWIDFFKSQTGNFGNHVAELITELLPPIKYLPNTPDMIQQIRVIDLRVD